jgi:CubicO group peptidase (beta-lactamase class C family)
MQHVRFRETVGLANLTELVQMRGCQLIIGMLLLVTGCASVPRPRIDEIVTDAMRVRGIPAVGVAIVKDGRVVLDEAWGYADVERNVRATPATLFPIASITKVFAGTAVMQLVHHGRIDVNRPLRSYLPELPAAWSEVTVKHALTHLTGLPDIAVDPKTGMFEGSSAADAVASVMARQPVAAPGSTFAYQIIGYLLLDLLVARVTGRTVDQVVHERLFAPLGLASTTYPRAGALPASLVTVYRRTADNSLVPVETPWQTWDHMVRGLATSASDLARFDAALSRGEVLPGTLLQAMWKPAVLNDGTRATAFDDPRMGYAAGWTWYDFPEGKAVGHSGSNMSQYLHYLDIGISVVVLTNLQNSDPLELGRAIARAVRQP